MAITCLNPYNYRASVSLKNISLRCFKWPALRHIFRGQTLFFRYEVQTVGDVLDHLDDGLQHVIQAGIDRANQSARVTAHMICDWRIMPNQFTYEVKKNQLYLTTTVVTPHWGKNPQFIQKIHHFKVSFFIKFTISKSSFFTKFTFSKSHFSQNSHF